MGLQCYAEVRFALPNADPLPTVAVATLVKLASASAAMRPCARERVAVRGGAGGCTHILRWHATGCGRPDPAYSCTDL